MAGRATLTIETRRAWWLALADASLRQTLAALCGARLLAPQPAIDWYARLVLRGMRWRVAGGPWRRFE